MTTMNSRIAAVARIVVGGAALLELATVAPRLMTLTGTDVIRAPYFGAADPIAPWSAVAMLVAWAAGATAFLLGAFTPVAATTVIAALVAVLLVDQQLYSNHLYLMVLLIGLLALAGAGRAVSVDARRHGENPQGPSWPMLLVRSQVSIVYLFAALSKINATYLSGSVLATYLRADGPGAIPTEWRSFELMAALSLVTIIMELLVAVGLWLRRWRGPAMTLGLFLHLGTIVWMTVPYQLLVFSLLMFGGYLAFLAPARASVTVVWDDSCGFCAGWVRWFRRLDWMSALTFVPLSSLPVPELPVTADQAAEAMHAVTPRSTRAGFPAVARVLAVLPVSFLWAPLLDLPPVRAIGGRAYRSVARRRTCSVPLHHARESVR